MTAYYNEIDKDAAAVIEQAMKDGLIAPGVVDTRSIEEVTANDISDFTQCHFFAGGGGVVTRSQTCWMARRSTYLDWFRPVPTTLRGRCR